MEHVCVEPHNFVMHVVISGLFGINYYVNQAICQINIIVRKWSTQVMSFRPNPFHANYILNMYNMSYIMYLNKILFKPNQYVKCKNHVTRLKFKVTVQT